MILDDLDPPIVLAPLAGGPSTPALAAAVSEAGGFGFLASGYLTAVELATAVDDTRALTTRPFGVNLFVPGAPTAHEVYAEFEQILAGEAAHVGVLPGSAHFDDDDWQAKLALLNERPVAAVSFTFGCPEHGVVTSLQRAGSEVWVTVTTLEEAIAAVSVGADALIVQGAEAGGHRASFDDLATNDLVDGLSLSVLLQLVLDVFDVPCVASGGLMTGRSIAGVLSAGAVAAQLGTAFLRTPEAGTSPLHLDALGSQEQTAMTRAFTGRLARGIRNRFTVEYTSAAPSAYPEIHFVTAPIRAAGRKSGNVDIVNLWAGQAYLLSRELPAGELVRLLADEIVAALASATRRIRV